MVLLRYGWKLGQWYPKWDPVFSNGVSWHGWSQYSKTVFYPQLIWGFSQVSVGVRIFCVFGMSYGSNMLLSVLFAIWYLYVHGLLQKRRSTILIHLSYGSCIKSFDMYTEYRLRHQASMCKNSWMLCSRIKSFRITDWTHIAWNSIRHLHLSNKDNLQKCFSLNSWWSLWCLVPLIHHCTKHQLF